MLPKQFKSIGYLVAIVLFIINVLLEKLTPIRKTWTIQLWINLK